MNDPGLPAQMPRGEYSRTATRDARGALALALRRLVEGITFSGSQATRFAEVYDEWPTFNETLVVPAAAVLPGEHRYEAWSTSPHLLEETWEPAGMPGWGLYQTAEVAVDFQLAVRTNLPAERPVLMQAIEDAFQPEGQLMDQVNGPRYGLVVPIPEYYGLAGRFAVLSGSVVDNEDSAMREKRDAVFVISARVPKVQVGPVWPLALRIERVTDSAGALSVESVIIR